MKRKFIENKKGKGEQVYIGMRVYRNDRMEEKLERCRETLDNLRNKYKQIKKRRVKNAKQFCDSLFDNLIKKYDTKNFNKVKMFAEQFFQVKKVRFTAVDGSCYKKQFQDHIVFFSVAYLLEALSQYMPRIWRIELNIFE